MPAQRACNRHLTWVLTGGVEITDDEKKIKKTRKPGVAHERNFHKLMSMNYSALLISEIKKKRQGKRVEITFPSWFQIAFMPIRLYTNQHVGFCTGFNWPRPTFAATFMVTHFPPVQRWQPQQLLPIHTSLWPKKGCPTRNRAANQLTGEARSEQYQPWHWWAASLHVGGWSQLWENLRWEQVASQWVSQQGMLQACTCRRWCKACSLNLLCLRRTWGSGVGWPETHYIDTLEQRLCNQHSSAQTVYQRRSLPLFLSLRVP